MDTKKVYITGIGALVGEIPAENGNYMAFDSSKYESLLEGFRLRGVDRVSSISLATTLLALKDSGLEIKKGETNGYGLFFGTAYGALESIHSFDCTAVEKGALNVNPGLFPNTVLNAPACQVEIQQSIDGPVYTICNGSTSSLDAIGMGYLHVRHGHEPAILAGGSDEVSGLTFRIHKSKFPLYEASGFVVIESEDLANFRKATLKAEILGFESIEVPPNKSDLAALMTAQLIKHSIDELSKSLSDIKKIYFCGEIAKDTGLKVVNILENEIEFEVLEEDYMGGNGIITVSRVLREFNSNDENALAAIANLGDDRISLLIIRKIK